MATSIALFLPTLRGGGAERVVLRLARELLDRGHQVAVVVADARGPYRPLVPDDAEFVDLGVRFLPTSVVPMTRWLRRRRPDAVLSAINGANVVALAARRLARVHVPIVVTEHNTLSQWRTDRRSFQRRWAIPWLMRRLYPQADGVVAVSRASARDLARFLDAPDDHVHPIVNPVVDDDLVEQARLPLPDPWEQRLTGGPLIVAVGRIVSQKDPEMLVRAFAQVHARRSDARLALVGEGDLRPAVERLRDRLGLEDALWLPGFQDNPYAWMARADVVALSSRYEGLPTVLIEALACGARVVATDCPGGSSEILEDGRWGRLVQVGDEQAFADSLLASIEEGRWPSPPTEAFERYRPQHVVDEYLALLGPLLRPTAG